MNTEATPVPTGCRLDAELDPEALAMAALAYERAIRSRRGAGWCPEWHAPIARLLDSGTLVTGADSVRRADGMAAFWRADAGVKQRRIDKLVADPELPRAQRTLDAVRRLIDVRRKTLSMTALRLAVGDVHQEDLDAVERAAADRAAARQ